MVNDNDLQSAILEETMKEMAKVGDPNLVSDVLHNLNEIGAEGKMSKAYKVNPERDESLITLYSTFDGTASTVLRTMAPKLLRKRIPRIPEAPREKWGDLAFSLTPPKDALTRPKFLCDLHVSNPRREWLDSIGLNGRYCPKDNLANAYEVGRHRRSYHHDEDALITQAETKEQQELYNSYQKNIADILTAQAKGSRRNVSD